MDLFEKLTILSDAAKYDVSCSSSGSSRANKGGMGNGHVSGICHSWSEDGRCISLLKVLMTNQCVFDCAYCLNRRSNHVPRAAFSPDELVDLTLEFYRRNYIEGLFLSSGIYPNIDETSERMVQVAKKLRERGFYGYIHMKIIPGTDAKLVAQLGSYIDRGSVNIELPSTRSLALLAPQKTQKSIMGPMRQISETLLDQEEGRKGKKKTFIPAGQTTQMIIGASGESDRDILSLSELLYQRQGLKRVYFSAYVPVNQTSLVPAGPPPLKREHRLYQGDFLLRFYQFKAREILTDQEPNFDLDLDPKASWALHHMDLFPMEINRASYEELLRIPGIGPRYARRILQARRYSALTTDSLRSLNISVKRAKHFILAQGKALPGAGKNLEDIRRDLVGRDQGIQQMSFLPWFFNMTGPPRDY